MPVLHYGMKQSLSGVQVWSFMMQVGDNDEQMPQLKKHGQKQHVQSDR